MGNIKELFEDNLCGRCAGSGEAFPSKHDTIQTMVCCPDCDGTGLKGITKD